MPLTFIHTSDWHLGYIYRGIGRRAAESEQWRFDAVRRLFDVASTERADFIVVAGDVFHTDTPSSRVIRAAVALLRDAPAPMYLISGNHDPYAEGSVWRNPEFFDALRGVANVRFALEPMQPQMLDAWDTELFPCAITSKHTAIDTTAWIPKGTRGGRTRLGLAHGHWRGYASVEGAYNMIDAECADRCGLDYLALGDFHSYTLPDHPAARRRTYYSGTPEVSAVDDQRAGSVLVVRLEAPGAEPTVTPHTVGRCTVVNWGNVALPADGGLDELQARLATIPKREDTLLRARLVGALSNHAMRELEAWINTTSEEFLGADIKTDGLFSEPAREDFEALGLAPVERSILEGLDSPLSPEDLAGLEGGDRIASWSANEAARREARTLYFQLLREHAR